MISLFIHPQLLNCLISLPNGIIPPTVSAYMKCSDIWFNFHLYYVLHITTQLWFPENQLHSDMKTPTMQGFWNKPQMVQERQDWAALPNSRRILCTSSHSHFGRATDTLGRVKPTCLWLKLKSWFSSRPPAYLSNATTVLLFPMHPYVPV